jgi:hypothetical protein
LIASVILFPHAHCSGIRVGSSFSRIGLAL